MTRTRSGFSRNHVAMRAEHHVERPHRGRVRIFDQRADAARERHAGAGFGADIGVDVAARQRDMHFAEGDADRLDVLDRHAFHAQPLQEEHFLRRARKHRDALAFEVLDRGDPGVLLGDDRHAAIAGRGNHHDRFAGRGAEQRSRDAERAEIDRLGHDRILALGRAFRTAAPRPCSPPARTDRRNRARWSGSASARRPE